VEPISRRRAIQLGGLGLAATIAGGVGLVVTARDQTLGPGGRDAFRTPEVLTSTDGVLDVTLTAAEGTHQVAGRDATTFAYNGTVPGPTLRLRPGDRLRLRLVNDLPQGTNLHTHGLLVSPEGNSDNVFIHIEPGESFDYEYRLPDDHPPGLFWYHPHQHGLVADQLFAGMYGAILVEDREEPPFTRERVLVVSDITLDGAGRVRQPSQMERMMGREGELVLVNGQTGAVLSARPAERERWRVVNACSSRFLSLRLDGQSVRLLGRDIGPLAEPQDVEEVLLTPGSRAELAVTTVEGRSTLRAMPVDRGGGMMMGRVRSDEEVALATLDVSGSSASELPALPAQPELRDLRQESVDGRRELVFQMGRGMGMGPGGMSFTIDGKTFDHERIDQEVAFGSVEEWRIVNDSPMDHPFHLHVWPMQVIEESGRPVGTPTWLDVVNLPAGGSVTVRIAFERFGGRTVYHCHILDHEDLGMMAVVRAR
jgi:FtsP/CotA-like multicopper oxidase with cupredoxin domain